MHRESTLERSEVSELLVAAHHGDQTAMERVIPLVYEDLRVRAHRQIERDQGSRTVRPIDLVREAYDTHARVPVDLADRARFLAIAARAMRKMLVDHARSRRPGRRSGAGWQRATLADDDWIADFEPHELLALDSAIDGLEPRQRAIVECRFFGGMDEAEIARALGVSERVVKREWVKARAWLYCHLYGAPPC
jgi:RNA polymerase sigma-70 factor (ECF subfamily)